MDQSIKQGIQECAEQSNAGAITFPEGVGALMKLGVESYFADYRSGEITYYTKQGDTCTASLNLQHVDVPLLFDAAAIQEAIRASQRDEIRYPEFKKRSIAAGCVGYFVWIDGRQVSYYGRRGEVHVEKFPDKK